MRRKYLIPRLIFEKHALGAVAYWFAVLAFLCFMFMRTNSKWAVFIVFLIIAVIPNGMTMLKGPIWVIDQEQIRVFVQGKPVAALTKEDVTFAGLYMLPDNTRKLWITNLPEAYFIKYLSRHERTARMLYSGKQYEEMISNKTEKLKVAISVFLHRNDCGQKNTMLFYSIAERDIRKIRCIWDNLLVIDFGRRAFDIKNR